MKQLQEMLLEDPKIVTPGEDLGSQISPAQEGQEKPPGAGDSSSLGDTGQSREAAGKSLGSVFQVKKDF